MRPRCALARWLLAVVVMAVPARAGATDFPAANARVKLRRHPTSKTFQLVLKPPPFFPVAGSADDPTVTPGGMLIEIFSLHEARASLVAPRGDATNGWRSSPTRVPPRLDFRNPDAPDQFSPVKTIAWVSSRVLKISAR